MDGTQVGVFEQAYKVGLASLLQGHDGSGLEPQVVLEVLGDLPNQPLEWQLADQELSRLLITADLSQGHSPRPVSVGLRLKTTEHRNQPQVTQFQDVNLRITQDYNRPPTASQL